MESGTVELDYRRGAALEVSLLWRRHSNELVVVTRDHRTGEVLEIPVAAPDQARYAFQHPFAYAALIAVDDPRAAASTHRVDVID